MYFLVGVRCADAIDEFERVHVGRDVLDGLGDGPHVVRDELREDMFFVVDGFYHLEDSRVDVDCADDGSEGKPVKEWEQGLDCVWGDDAPASRSGHNRDHFGKESCECRQPLRGRSGRIRRESCNQVVGDKLDEIGMRRN